MPIYEYQCDACDQTFEAIRKFSDAPLEECRKCGASGVRKLLSAPSFRLAGGGWYETDFKKKDAQRNVAKKDGDGGGSSGGDKSGSGGSGSGGSGSGGSEGAKPSSGESAKSTANKASEKGASKPSGSGGSASKKD